jgi:hypothetical protein
MGKALGPPADRLDRGSGASGRQDEPVYGPRRLTQGI